MATSLTGQALTDRALAAAPVPRPPQPISATWMVLLSAVWTCGRATPARAEAAASLPVFLINSRREVGEVGEMGFSFIGDIFWTAPEPCQFKKFRPEPRVGGAKSSRHLRNANNTKPPARARSSPLLKLFPDKPAPDFVGLPDRVQVALGLGDGSALMEDSVKENKHRDALVGRAMNEHAPVLESLHHTAKGAEIL